MTKINAVSSLEVVHYLGPIFKCTHAHTHTVKNLVSHFSMLFGPYVICTCYSFAYDILHNSLVITDLRSTIIILFVKLFQLFPELLPPNILETPL